MQLHAQHILDKCNVLYLLLPVLIWTKSQPALELGSMRVSTSASMSLLFLSAHKVSIFHLVIKPAWGGFRPFHLPSHKMPIANSKFSAACKQNLAEENRQIKTMNADVALLTPLLLTNASRPSHSLECVSSARLHKKQSPLLSLVITLTRPSASRRFCLLPSGYH